MAVRTRILATAAECELVITRVVDAPRSLVFKAWTEPEHFVRWWGPNGFTTPFCKMDVRPGGVTHFCMRWPEGRDYWGRWVYREVVPPERIVFTDTFADEEGNPAEPARYGMPDWPFETLVTVTLGRGSGQDEAHPASRRRPVGSRRAPGRCRAGTKLSTVSPQSWCRS